MRTGKYIVDMHKSTEETQSIKRMMRFAVMMLLMMCFGVGEVWAQVTAIEPTNIIINGGTKNGDIYTIKDGETSTGTISISVSGREVTLVVTPAANYSTKTDLITVEKMVSTFAPRRAPELADLIVGTMYNHETARADANIITSVTYPSVAYYVFTVPNNYDGAYVTVTFVKEETDVTLISSLSEIPANATGYYKLTRDIAASSHTSISGFQGTLDGDMHKIINLSSPLFTTISGNSKVKNVVLDNVQITSGTDGKVGAICCEATGNSRIFNCGILASNSTLDAEGNFETSSSSVSGSSTDFVGGLVGELSGTARVINCFSYANITGGGTVGGIVGNNTVATTSDNLGTMVMNCIFYGDIDAGCTSKAPIYNGTIITNDGDDNGVNNFNYFWSGASYVKNKYIDVYNCALSAETRFLQRFEFFRNLLNSNRELAAWWVTGSANDKDQMMKWVLEPNQIGTATPFPILKTPGKYYSVVNYDADHAEEIDAKNEHRNEGRKLTSMGGTGANAGKLAVTIQMGNGAVYNHPTGAAITLKEGETEKTIYLVITDKDTAHYNFNYGKVQLPYYNDYGTNNYTGNRVVTGWKIVSITGGTTGSYSTGADDVTYNESGELTATPYNFADRKCTNKDLYDGTGEGKPGSDRVFNQGAYWDVPDGVTAITIEPYWGKAVYLADPYWDIVYKNNNTDDMATAADVTTIGGGQRFENGQKYNIATRSLDNENGQVVFTFIEDAIASSGSGSALFQGVTGTPANQTVYDYAVVLVGNYHHTTTPNADNSKPYTVTSVDLDGDNEPDYSLMLRFNGRTGFHPVRYDFLNLIGLGMAQKTTGGTGSYNLGIMQPKYWFEVTNTALFRVTQFEYSPNGRVKKPIILQGGVIEQWVTQQQNAGDLVEYFHVGGNVWFKEFHRGSHQDNPDRYTPHPPVSVTGGDFDKFYLTGLYQSQATIYDDNAECYISGGRFGKMAGAGMEGIGTTDGKGNVTWIIDHADIKEFYGGGINYDKPIHGNIHTIISNSYVDLFCGGPKFGDMEENRTVKTIATNCTFGTYFGAGYGGNSYNRYAPKNKEHLTADPDWNSWVTAEYKQDYSSTYKGVSTQIDYQYIPESSNTMNVARLWVEFVGFSLATTNDVTSNLTGCTVKGNFYGGGSLGKVDGDATSTLTDCTVNGSVFGAGYSGSTPTVEVMPMQFIIQPGYDNQAGSFSDGVVPSKTTTPPTVTYTWKHRDNVASTATAIDKTNHILYTTEDLTSLGTVTGKATLNLEGTTTVDGNVYGGGEESNVAGDTEISMSGGTVNGDVFGGGKGEADEFTCAKAMVGVVDQGVTDNGENANPRYTLLDGGTTVSISNGRVKGNVYGGGEVGRVERNTIVTIGDAENATTPIIEGSVFGAGAGVETHGYSALVRGNATVTIQGSAQVWQNVYGGGEKASVGRYYVASSPADVNTYHVPIGMPCYLKAGGKCTVNILGSASIGTDDDENTGHVFGAGQGLNPHAVTYTYQSNETKPYRMKNDNSWEYFASESDYLTFVETLAIASETDVIIGGKRETTGESEGTITPSGNPTIKGTVYGGSESGFVYHGTDVTIKNGTINGDAFGGGKGLATYAEAGRVRENTKITMSDGTVKGNIYGGGSLGDVGKINKTLTGYNYKWTDDAVSNNDAANTTYAYNNTGLCEVEINGGTIGTDNDNTTGHVFGAGKGLADTFYCEKAMVYTTDVSVTAGTVKGNIYGGGQLGRVEDNTVVTIGTENETTGSKKPDIKGGVFGAGAGVATHGYSALVRGNSTVTVQGKAEIEKNVYGGGEIASVGRFRVENSLPKEPLSGGTCTVTIKGDAKVGTGSDGGSVYGACKGVEPDYTNSGSAGHVINTGASVDFNDEDDYLAFLQTLALTSNTNVTINGNASVNGSVFGGGRRGITLGDVTVNMTGGTVNQDVYGGGALANTNTGNWNSTLSPVSGLTIGESIVTGYSIRTGSGTTSDPYEYEEVTAANTTASEDITYCSINSWADVAQKSAKYKTFVNILGGSMHDVYGGGLGDASTPAYVWGDVKVNLNGLDASTDIDATLLSAIVGNEADKPLSVVDGVYQVKGTKAGAIVNQIFGCNNLNGSPKGHVKVHVFATQNSNTTLHSTINSKFDKRPVQGENDTENSKETSLEYLQRLINAAYVKDNQGDPTNDLLPGITGTVITAAQETHDVDNPAATEEQLNEAITNVQQELMKLYDVEAVYGGGNQAEYYPVDADSETEAVKNAARTEVVIDGCDYTSIKEVYAGGNAASTPATYVRVNAAYEINEVFGGGNGRDNLFVTENNTTVEYENPGANVGYHNYTEWGTAGTDGVIPAVEKDDAGTPEDRANSNYRYGSGIATTWVTGGRIHNVYGGSNEKGNVSTTAVSVYQEADDSCPLIIDETYGGGKNSQMDGTIDLKLDCVKNMKEIFGGAKNADVNDDIVLNITNGTFEKVFGGNNTSGAINGSITVNVKEEGCSPIEIDELYGGGYLAGYSIYGYYTDANNNKIPRTKLDFKAALISAIGNQLSDANKEAVAATLADARNIDEVVIQAALTANNITDSGNTIATALKTAFGNAELLGFPKNDPRINVISATRIGNIFGGGYEAKVVGSPRVNVNMKDGTIEVKKVEVDGNPVTYKYVDIDDHEYSGNNLLTVGTGVDTKYYGVLARGDIGNIYGGGNKADIEGNTYVEIGTGQWVTTWDANGNPVWGTEDANGNKYIYNEQSAARNYTEKECIDYNALLDGAMSSTDALTAEQATAYNTAIQPETNKKEGDELSATEANAYNATLDGAVTTNDIKPAVWAWYKVGVANDPGTTTTPTPARNAATITGNVFGGGKGLEDNFLCDKAMVGIAGAGVDENTYPNGYPDGNTNVTIANGTIAGSVYGGGEVGRVEMNTTVTIGIGDGVDPTDTNTTPTSAPEITGSVYGGGKGVETHGYSALVRGNPTVVVQGNAKVRGNVYGGGQIASVARYNVAQSDAEGAPYGVKKDEPYALRTNSSGFCTVTVRGYAEIGPTSFDSNAKETLVGHVFGAGKGIVPGGEYAYDEGTTKRMVALRDGEGHIIGSDWDYFDAGESDYITFIKTLALSSQTNVTIDGHATVKGSVFGGSESGFVQFDTNVTVKDGSIGTTGKGGADFGNVYGGGKGDAVHTGSSNNYVEAGLVKGNTKVKVEGGRILHNIYGGGAYGTVGEFTYGTDGMPTGRRTYTINNEVHNTTGGNTEVYITGGTIGTNGDENGMVFGSSRGDVGDENSIHNKLAWVYDTHVAIGDTTTTTTSTTTPLIKGSIYGGGENGHNFRSSYVRINGGTIGMTSGGDITDDNGTPDDDEDDIEYSGAAYPYRGNVYGGGCGTDKYDSNNDNVNDSYNPLAGIVYGDATVTMTGGQIVHNVYGAGAMGSVGKATTINNVTTITGGTTTINISGGTLGVDGTAGEGNVFGAARGSDDATGDDLALVRKSTSVSISGTTQGTQIKGNVYGGGELGCVGVFTETTDGRYVWTTGTGDSNVEITGGSITGSVFGAGKGKDDTFKCEKGMVKATSVSITAGAVGGDVYGGGEVGRVEYDTEVKIGDGAGTANGTPAPAITRSVFGGGAGVETHGYSALVRGNTTVTVEGNAQIGEGVYGGGEIASVGRYGLDADKMPSILLSGGECKVTVQGYATIGTDVFGAGKGVNPHFDKDNTDKTKRSRRMTLYTNATDFPGNDENTTWERVIAGATLTPGSTLIWQYFQDEDEYSTYLETLALATAPVVTIGGNAKISSSVFGGGEVGLTKGSVVVNILGGTIAEDVYGGGALANTNTTSLVGVLIDGVPKKDNKGNIETTTVHPTTKVNLLGGTIDGDVYGGGLGCLDFAGKKYTSEEATAYNTANNFSSTDDGYVTVNDYKERPVTAVKAFVYGDIKVNLNGLEADDYIEDIHKDYVQAVGSAQSPDYYELKTTQSGSGTEQDPTVINYPKGAIVNQIFGCNNLNGSPKKHVKVHVFATQSPVNGHNTLNSKYPQRPAQGKNETYAAYLTRLATTYSEVTAVTAKISAAQAANATLTEKTTAYNSAIDEEAQATALAELNAAQAAFDAAVAALNAEFLNLYDVKAVYGGGNLAAYEPIDPKPDTDWNDTEEYTEVIIDGCDLTSIETVYGGGNAASVPASYVRVNGTQEIEELFGGGNGKDNYSLDEGSSKVWYKNPGANVGYYNYTHYVKKNEAGYNATNDGAGTSASPYIVHDNTNASTVDDRKTYYKYGSGITTIEVTGGLIHATFGGSNTKGNIREKAESTYEDAEICPMRIDETYGGGKDSPMDAEIDMALDCVKDMDMIFGGSKNADVDNNITLNITNGTFQKVFGGNNTSGAINGAITVNIEEKGCQPIEIDELYLGGYLAPYSVYGYEKNTDGSYKTEIVDGIEQRIPLKSGTTRKDDPRLNVISATRIGDIFGGGYKATIVGDPYVNVNMTEGKVNVEKVEVTKTEVSKKEVTRAEKTDGDETNLTSTEGETTWVYYTEDNNTKTYYDPAKVEKVVSGESPTYHVYYTVEENVETVYDPAKVEKGTPNYIYKAAAAYFDPTKVETVSGEPTKYYVYIDGNNNAYEQTNVSTDEKSGTLPIGTIGNIYGGGNEADIIGSTHVEIGTGRWVTAWENGYPVYETEYIDTNDDKVKHLYYKEQSHAVYYTVETANEYNASLTGALSTEALTAEQAEAYNSAIHPETDKVAGDNLSADEVASYNAKLPGAVRVGDVKTAAEWAWYTNEDDTEPCSVTTAPTPTRNAAQITGNVFGGGKGVADNFYCNKAMVGIDGAGVDANNHPTGYRDGNTNVTIANGSVGGSVYGGGEIGRVEMNSTVTIGDGDGVASGTPTSAPVIEGSVFGGGKGKETHGYAALVRGNPTVIVQGNAKVRGNVYGGGEIASVARYKVKLDPADPDAPVGWPMGMPYALKNANSGFCTVTIGGYAEIGPEEPMHMVTTSGMPDDAGHVFGAGQGILPKEYTYADDEHKPKRMVLNDDKTASIWEYFANENTYIGFIQTLALASQTEVTIKDHAFVKGSVYGGSFNGIVQYNTHVTIDGDCQIGAGENVNRRYTTDEWAYDGSTTDNSLPECASWPYGKEIPLYENGQQVYDNNNQPVKTKVYLPFDIYDLDANNKPKAASDGHTFYGNVFGGGSGYYPYRRKNASPALDGVAWTKNDKKTYEVGQPVDKDGYSDGVWLSFAGIVRGNTTVDILGGHILTSAYGGNEQTDVMGSCTVNMSGGTLGVPRTLAQIAAHPVTCYLFGAGKGDQRINFNTWTNVASVNVNITGGKIYGSVFGGGEDGHVLGDVTMNIGQAQSKTTKIGTWGTSYVDGNVFGGGRGFSGEAQTAGTVGGNVTMNITGGEMLGSIYGGGRLASVGTQFASPEDDNYGNFVEDNEDILYTQEECDAYNATLFGYIAAGTALTAAQAETVNAALETSYEAGQTLKSEHAAAYTAKLYGYKTTNDIRIPAGSYGHITINISGGTIGNDLESIIPTYGENGNIPGDITETNIKKWTAEDWAKWKNHNHIPNTDFELYDSVKIENSDQYTYKYHAAHTKGGNVFGGSMGRLQLLNGKTNPIWPRMAQVKTATVTISGNANIKRTVYGGGELGTVRNNTLVTVTGGTVGYDVYGGGYGSEDDDTRTVFEVKELKADAGDPPYETNDYELHTYGFTPMQFAGCVGQSTTVNVTGGYIRKSVYGGGEMASVGIINSRVIPKNNAQINPKEDVVFLAGASESYIFEHFHKHGDADNGFALSWPYHFEYTPTFEGDTHVHITGGRLGLKANDEDESLTDNGDVYGGGKGIAGDFNDYVFCANVGSTDVRIEYDENDNLTLDPKTYKISGDCISGAVYGGGENGHVIGDAKVTLTNGLVGHSVYGGGSGKGKFPTTLVRIGKDPESTDAKDHYTRDIYSITAGKVFGNTEVEMTGGYVVRNVYGGGNMGSVGKGNYAGGPDDYSAAGYGEKLSGDNKLWDGNNKFSQAFLHSGKCTVTITGGTIGYIDESNPSNSMYPWNSTASLPYGNVFGGCRGESAPNIVESPRYLYSPEFFVGYANETEVIIGTSGQSNENAGQSGKAPRILGSVYGGGMDGHIRRDTYVTINSGEIGMAYTTANRQKVGTLPASPTTDQINSTADLDDLQWLARGNVYGAGSGIGKYQYDFNYDGDFGDVVYYNNGRTTVATNEEDYSTSAGSVTRFTTVNINGGIIHRNVYGGGSLSTVGAPKIPPINYDPYRKGDSNSEGKQSLNQVNIAGTIGTPDGYGNDNTFKYNPVYGGEVYGASRGEVSLGSSFSNAVWTEVNLLPGARVQGNVFGGGDSGPVKQDSEVNVGVTFDITSTAIEDDAMSILQAGDNQTIYVTSNATWEVKSSASWLTVSQKSGDGNGTIKVTATANNGEGATPRTATITISAPGQTKTISVTQAGGS